MKITIDTASDSEQDIRKVITLLSTLVDRDRTPGQDGVSLPSLETAHAVHKGNDGNIFSMFDTTPAAPSKPAEKQREQKEKPEPFKIDELELY